MLPVLSSTYVLVRTDAWVEGCFEFGRRRPNPTSERREVVQELSDEGLSQRKIADVLGVDVGTVNRDIHADDPVENATVEAGNAPARQNKSSASVESSTLNC